MAGSSSPGSSEWVAVDIEPAGIAVYASQVGERPPRVPDHTVSSVLRILESQQQTLQALVKEVCRQDDAAEQLPMPKVDSKKEVQDKGKSKKEVQAKGTPEKQSKVEVLDLPKGGGGCVHDQTSKYANQFGTGKVCTACGAKLFRRISGETVFTDPSASAASANTDEHN